MGLELNQLANSIFDDILKNISAQYAPNSLYISSSPSAGAIPFHVGRGTSHYYGVGGCMRSYEDARLFKGKFIAECLQFSHVPEDASLNVIFNGEIIPTHHPRWKEGVPRDVGAGWDFSDVTDFYVEKLFGVNATQLRATEPQRYLDTCRATSCEVVERTMSIFRADSAESRAALVWFLHDLKPGAGWGYIDSLGQPKSAFYGLARSSQATTVLFVDEGLEGLAVYVAHDGADTLSCQLEIGLITADGTLFEHNIQACELAPRSIQRVSVDAHLGRFVDSSYAYRFGARGFVATVAKLIDKTKLTDKNGALIAQKTYVDPSVMHETTQELGITATLQPINETSYSLTIHADKPAFFVNVDAPNCSLSDNYFHIMPGFDTQILLHTKLNQKPHGRIRVFNSKKTTPIKAGM
jgi:beta-mannosidase